MRESFSPVSHSVYGTRDRPTEHVASVSRPGTTSQTLTNRHPGVEWGVSTRLDPDCDDHRQRRGGHQYSKYRSKQKQQPSEPDVDGHNENRIEKNTQLLSHISHYGSQREEPTQDSKNRCRNECQGDARSHKCGYRPEHVHRGCLIRKSATTRSVARRIVSLALDGSTLSVSATSARVASRGTSKYPWLWATSR